MANASLNNLPVVKARVQRPRLGNWSAEVVVDVATAAQLAAASAAQLSLDGGALVFQGTVLRADVYAQLVTLRLVGGKNGLAKPCNPRFYRGSPLSRPLADVLKDAGEVLGDGAAADDVHLEAWTQLQQLCSQALSSLAMAAGDDFVWRVLADGTLFFGVDGFSPAQLDEYEVVDYQPLEGVQTLATEAGLVNPGDSFNGHHVSDVEHLVGDSGSRVRLWFES